MTVVHDLRVDSIVIGERLRPLSAAAVAELVESMTRVGQIQPITIARPNVVPHLVTGHHRLIAARELGWETIACVVLPADTSEDDRLQIEIAENLHRNALTKDERDRHVRLFAEILKRKRAAEAGSNPENKPGQVVRVSEGGGRGKKGVASEIAEQTGLSQRTVRRALNPQAEKDKAKSVADAADRAEAKAEAKRQREAEQAEFDRQEAEARAKLSDEINALEAAKAARRAAKAEAPAEPDDIEPEDRIAELEEAVRVLEAENKRLAAENEKFDAMRVEYEIGGFANVIAGKDEEIRVLMSRVEMESADKASWAKSAKYRLKELQKLGWAGHDREVIHVDRRKATDA